ncbi:DEAD/DEAH box helicase family protein [Williamsia sp.]|uniref:DEAD/DEAH box helicase family protein n=1 Tax=Williamsia sp. TaxID=1872085 RepID=UPI0025D21AD6|nr:DEAD/DEAH box helicase family protein [Williamsia sp.]
MPFVHSGQVLVPSGAKARAQANMSAIDVVLRCDTLNRAALPDEQRVLSQWSGWGAVSDIFDESKQEWDTPRRALREEYLTAEQYRDAKASTLNAHYTDPAIAAAMWDTLVEAGFDGGYVLEPGCGSGTFMGVAPASATMIGVENDPMTAQIAHLLYPNAQVRNEGFESTRVPENTFSATIGNVPFGGFSVHDPIHNPAQHNIHNHFLIKALRLTAPGGYVMAVTTSGTLDAANDKARRDMHALGDLVGAVRLPSNAFSRVAGTQVVTDILVLRKRELGAPLPEQNPNWLRTVKVEVADRQNGGTRTVDVNGYFERTPRHVLGTTVADHGMYRGGQMRVEVDPDRDTATAVRESLASIIASARKAEAISEMLVDRPTIRLTYSPHPVQAESVAATLEAGVATAAGLYGEDVPIGRVEWDEDSQGFVRKGIDGVDPIKVPKTRTTETRHLLRLRNLTEQVIASQRTDDTTAAHREGLRRDLGTTYDAYVAAYGPINRMKWSGGKERSEHEAMARLAVAETKWREDNRDDDGVSFLGELPEKVLGELEEKAWQSSPRVKRQTHLEAVTSDPGIAGVMALERFDEETGAVSKTAVFARDVVVAPVPVLSADTPEDAVAICMGERGRIDLDRIASLLGQDSDTTRESVRGLVFIDVDNPSELLPCSTALSGNVRAKHATAVTQVQDTPTQDWREVEAALAEVVPPLKQPSQMGPVALGATWIAPHDYAQFVRETFDAQQATVERAAGTWMVSVPAGQLNTQSMRVDYGADNADSHKSMSAVELLDRLMNQRPIEVRNSKGAVEEGAPAVDTKATVYAQVQAEKIAGEFRTWVWSDDDRRERLVTEWNNRFNTWVKPSHDGSRLDLPGLSPVFTPHRYQRDAVARVTAEPTVLLDHVVGAGKTGTMFMAAMELKRRGLVSQPWIVVPTHLIEQFGRELKQWYPAANVLVGAKGMDAEDRRVFAAQTATSDWDMVIIPSSVFEKIRVHPDQRVAYIRAQVAELDEEMTAGRAAGGQSDATVKRIEKAKKALSKKLEAATEQAKKDAGVTFEQTGADYLFIDEAHDFKNKSRQCAVATLALPKGSDKAEDLSMKLDYLRSRRQNEARAAGRVITPGAERVATFATGTPIANSLAEAWVMQQYLRPDVLEVAGVRSITDWAASFTATKSETVTNATGTRIMVVSKVAAFSNPKEMFAMAAQYTDVVTRDQVPAALPSFEGRQVITSTPGQERRDFITDLEYRMSNFDPREMATDNILKVINDGRNVAIDPMLANLAPDPGNTRADAVAEQVATIYHDTKDNRYRTEDGTPSPRRGGLQLVFCDRGTPKPGARSVYQNLKDMVVDAGVPAEAVVFIHDAKSPSQKLAMQADCRSGKIAVLVGSTPKMGTGLNVQARMVALHHMDVPWRPADLEQREGRMLRQGNQNPEVQIFNYVTESTTDTVMWATVESKAAFIQQAKTGQLGDEVTQVADIADDNLADAAAATKAAATGDPRYMRMAQLDSDVASLSALSDAHTDGRNHARSVVRNNDREIEKTEAMQGTASDLADKVAQWLDAGKTFSIEGCCALERKDRSADLLERARASFVELKGRGMSISVTLAEFDTGVVAKAARASLNDELYVWLDVPGRPQFYVTREQLWGKVDDAGQRADTGQSKAALANGLATRLENSHESLIDVPARLETKLNGWRREVALQAPRMDTPFSRADELAHIKVELASLCLEIQQAENSAGAVAKRAEAAARMGEQGRQPGWSLDLNPTEFTAASEGMSKDEYVTVMRRKHEHQAREWAEEHSETIALVGDFPAPATGALTRRVSTDEGRGLGCGKDRGRRLDAGLDR